MSSPRLPTRSFGVTCQGWRHVGIIFDFPAGWANATGIPKGLSGVKAHVEGFLDPFLLWTPNLRPTVARKQMLLSAMEAGFNLAVTMFRKDSEGVGPSWDIPTRYVPTLNQSMRTATGRAAFVETLRMIDVGNLVDLLWLPTSGGTIGHIEYLPPGNGPLAGSGAQGGEILDTQEVVLLSDADAVDELLDAFDDYNGYAGMEDVSCWPILRPGAANTASLHLWSRVSSFTGVNVAARIQSALAGESPWRGEASHSASSASVLFLFLYFDVLGTGTPQFDPQWLACLVANGNRASVDRRRLTSFYLACYAEVMSWITSQEIVARDYFLSIAHRDSTVELVYIVSIQFSTANATDPYAAGSAPTVSVTVSDPEYTDEREHELNHIVYDLSVHMDDTLDGGSLMDTYVADPLTADDLGGRGTVQTSGGATWIEFSLNDYLDVVTSDPVYDGHWIKRSAAPSEASIVQQRSFKMKYQCPLHTNNNPILHDLEHVPLLSDESEPNVEMGWVLGDCRFVSVMVKGEITEPVTDAFVVSQSVAGNLGAGLLATSGAAIAKLGDVLNKIDGFFGNQYLGTTQALNRDEDFSTGFTCKSPAAIAAQVDAAATSGQTTAVQSLFRVPVSGCSWSGLQAAHGTTPSGQPYWEAPYMSDGKVELLVEDFGLTGGIPIDGFNIPQWAKDLAQAGSDGPKLSAEADVMVIGSYKMEVYDDTPQS